MRRFAKLTALAGAIAATALTLTGAAGASSYSTHFSLYANGDSHATTNRHGNPVLTAGTVAGTSAQVQVVNVPSAAPLIAPKFKASQSGGGDPRWVIEFHNGCYLFGYGGTTGWSVNPGGVQNVSWPEARAAALACGLDSNVTAAFIVDDAGFTGKPVTLTHVSYGRFVLPTH